MPGRRRRLRSTPRGHHVAVLAPNLPMRRVREDSVSLDQIVDGDRIQFFRSLRHPQALIYVSEHDAPGSLPNTPQFGHAVEFRQTAQLPVPRQRSQEKLGYELIEIDIGRRLPAVPQPGHLQCDPGIVDVLLET